MPAIRRHFSLTGLSACALILTLLVLTPRAVADDDPPPAAAPPPPGAAPATHHDDRRFLGPEGEALPFRSDHEVLEFLHTARVVAAKRLATGINRAQKLTLEREGLRANAIFRVVERNLTAGADGRPDRFAARDSYVFELAAYKMSRLLGLDRVPPVVLREIDGERGSLQLWVENAVTEAGLLQSERVAEHPARRNLQKQIQLLFDQLIYNFDRHQGNSLYDTYGFLWYIDHTRSFRPLPLLPAEDSIAVCDRVLYESLRALDKHELRRELDPYLDFVQIDALIKRRAQLLERLDTLIEERGEEQVLFDLGARVAGKSGEPSKTRIAAGPHATAVPPGV